MENECFFFKIKMTWAVILKWILINNHPQSEKKVNENFIWAIDYKWILSFSSYTSHPNYWVFKFGCKEIAFFWMLDTKFKSWRNWNVPFQFQNNMGLSINNPSNPHLTAIYVSLIPITRGDILFLRTSYFLQTRQSLSHLSDFD